MPGTGAGQLPLLQLKEETKGWFFSDEFEV